ncbi:uncharacterized protein [Hyperolius riggenbachi]|uniref:uncharacterized protein isoform X3 n=1 Tax=Hyperolius riggenbachi TaxID=752182 RepID=UPI0035A337B6
MILKLIFPASQLQENWAAMEEASAAHCDESSEENHRSGNHILSDVLNGSDLTHPAFVASDHFKLEGCSESEDLLNNNSNDASDQDSFTNQRFVTSGASTTARDQIPGADNPKESIFTASMERNSVRYEKTLNPLNDSSQTGSELYKEQAEPVLSNYTLKKNINSDISGNGEIFQGKLETDAFTKELCDSYKVDLLQREDHFEDQVESCGTERSLVDGSKEKECLETNHFEDSSMSTFDKVTNDLLPETTAQNVESIMGSQNFLEGVDQHLGHSDKPSHSTDSESNVTNYEIPLKGIRCNKETGKPKTNLDHLDLLANSVVCEHEESTKLSSLDLQTKRFGTCLPKNNGIRRNQSKNDHQSLKAGRLPPLSHELEFVEEEDLSEDNDSSEEENMDNSLFYNCSKDGFDHRKERHQYVSDKLDPDVLQLLEMHLRKQQLVDIKEEGEEELLEVHINKEISRSDSHKLLRNIPPVLDMVLEEPELEHAGDTLEGSKTPSDVDSDDSSNVSAIEVGLMESLQYDLMSKSSKIDKNEIATILYTSSPDILCSGHKTKQKDGGSYSSSVLQYGLLQNKEPKAHTLKIGDPSYLQVIQEDVSEDTGPDFNSKDVNKTEDICETCLQSESSTSDPLKEFPEQPLALDRETTETLVTERTKIAEADRADENLKVTSVEQGLGLESKHERESHVVIQGSTEPLSFENKDNAFSGSETSLPESSNAESASGSPCLTFEGSLESNVHSMESVTSSVIQGSEERHSCILNDGGDFLTETYSSEQHDGADFVRNEDINLADLNKDLKVLKTNVKSEAEPIVPEAPLGASADMNTLHADLERKITSLLEKAHAADCRSSHLQAEAELLFKESIELRNECKSLSKEAAELLSMFTQQGVLHRHQMGQITQNPAEAEQSIRTTDTKPRSKETLSLIRKRNSRKKKGENQLQSLSQKYDFLRQEAPEIMRELQDLQQDLKNLPPYNSSWIVPQAHGEPELLGVCWLVRRSEDKICLPCVFKP